MKLKKGSKKAKAWGAKMKRLRNKVSNPITKKLKRRTSNMARRRTTRKRTARRSSSLVSGGKLMNGIFKVPVVFQKALLGLAVSEVSEQMAPQVVPYQNLAVAGAVGGLPGVAGAFLFNLIQGKGVTNTTGTGITFY
jgi:hypothetical protein